jgi:hypothetical protein
MSKRIDGLVPRGIFKEPKGPSKHKEEVYTSKPINVSDQELKDMNGYIINGVFRIKPEDDHNRLILQAQWYIANKNEVKAREVLKKAGLTSRRVKAYIDCEKSLQRRKPEDSGFNNLYNKPMPEDFRVRGN